MKLRIIELLVSPSYLPKNYGRFLVVRSALPVPTPAQVTDVITPPYADLDAMVVQIQVKKSTFLKAQ
jgi:hypothetical protein